MKEISPFKANEKIFVRCLKSKNFNKRTIHEYHWLNSIYKDCQVIETYGKMRRKSQCKTLISPNRSLLRPVNW
jgi:hypothetical protein